MRNFLRSWPSLALRRRGRFVAPRLEQLENRIVFALSATPLSFTAAGTAHAAAALMAPNDFQLYQVHLQAGDVVTAAVSSQAGGGALQSNLRIFDASGRPMALDAQQGGDARLTFQAPRNGNYLVGVSSAGDDIYDPSVATSGQGGTTTGLYALDLQRQTAALTPDLAGASFQLQTDTAAYDDTVVGRFTVDNRGGAAAGAFDVQLLLSANNVFGPSSQVLTTFELVGLPAGHESAPYFFSIQLPDPAQATVLGLPASGPVYVGLRIDPAGVVPELNPYDQSGVHAGEDWQTLTVVTPVTANGSNQTPASAQKLSDLNSRVSGVLGAGQTDWYQLTVPTDMRLTATVSSDSTLAPRLTLANSDGRVLVQSDSALVQQLPAGTYLAAVSTRSGSGSYQLTVAAVPASDPLKPLSVGKASNYVSEVAVADVNGDGKPDLIVVNKGSYNYSAHSYSDGTVSVLLGNGDGTFGTPQTFDAGGDNSYSVVAADLTGDGKPDLVVLNKGDYDNSTYTYENGNVSVLMGKGDGTFGSPQIVYDSYNPKSLAVADLNGDGKPDLIVANQGGPGSNNHINDNGSVSVLLGNGDGAFGTPQTFDVGTYPYSVAAADLNGDGKPDLVAVNWGKYSNTTHTWYNDNISVLLGNGDGSFGPAQTLDDGNNPLSVAVADVTGDGKNDLVVANYGTFDPTTGSFGSSGVSVFVGNGDGTFQSAKTTTITGGFLYSMTVADVNGDGKPDLVAGNGAGGQVGVMLGNGNGTFRAPQSSLPLSNGISYPSSSTGLVVADLNGDGKPDIVAAGRYSNQVTVLLGNGDGTFQDPAPSKAINSGAKYPSVTATDVNGDGKLDIITAGYYENSPVSLLLGNGDGTFLTPQTLPGITGSVTVADVNGDGKPDIIEDNTGRVFLGLGDGSFLPLRTRIGKGPLHVLAAGDVNGDHKTDLITASYDSTNHSATIHVLLGNGDGTFKAAKEIATFTHFYGGLKLIEADLNGDGKPPDLIVSYDDKNSSTNYNYKGHESIQVLLNNGHGTFQAPQSITSDYTALLGVADLDGDGKPDLVTTYMETYHSPTGKYTYHSPAGVSVLPGNGDGTFQPAGAPIPVPFSGNDAFVAEIKGDGTPELVLGYAYSSSSQNGGSTGIAVLLGDGKGGFQAPQFIANGYYNQVAAVADLTGDGRPDIIAEGYGGGLQVLLNNPDGSFTPAPPSTGVMQRNIPYLADLTGDGLADSVVINSAGAILFRKGLPGTDNSFAPPVTLNGPRASTIPTRPARDLTVLQTAQGMAIATADAANLASKKSGSQSVYTVSLYRVADDAAKPGGISVLRTTAFTTGKQPTRIVASDLTGDGLDDIIVADAADNSIQIAFQRPDGTFKAPITLPTEDAPSDITVADFNGDGLPDIAVSDQNSGEVTVFLNDPAHSFKQSYVYRAGTGLYGLGTSGTTPVISSLEQTVSLAAGDFTGNGSNDLVVVNNGSDSLSVLTNDGQGGFANPQPALTFSTSEGKIINTQAEQVVAGRFHGPDQPADLAVLMQDLGQVWIYTGNGDGTFRHTFSIAAGSQPTGMNVVLDPQTGLEDLLIGDSFGDVLRLQGKGDGTFQFAGRRTTLSVQDLSNGHTDVLVANQQSDRVTIQAPQPGSSQLAPVVTLADGTQSTLAPGAVQWAKLDKNSPFYDAIVVASGGNEVLVYRGTGFDSSGNPTFAAPVTYAVGTNPVSVTVQDLDDDGIADLIVSNQGSNDVSLIFGSWNAKGDWVGTIGPRLKSGGSGPIAAQAIFPINGSLPELMITNGQSGNFAVLSGEGNGFFNDKDPHVINLPGNPVIAQGPSFFGSTGAGVLLTAMGQLVGFNVDDLSESIETEFTPSAGEQIVADQALANGEVVAVLSSGTVEDLAPGQGGGLTPFSTFVALTGIPSQPSALAVLQEESGIQVLVTGAGGDQVFTFSIPESSEGQVPPEAPTGPVVDVTPLSGEPLAVVATLTAETGALTTLVGNLGAVEAAELAEAELFNLGLASLGGGSPAWALGLLTRLLDGESAEDAEGDEVEGQDPKAVVIAEKPHPAPDGLDLDKLLRELDLYQPPPTPERPGSISRRPGEGRGQESIARTSAPDVETRPADRTATAADAGPPRWWTRVAEVVAAMDCVRKVPPPHTAISDAVLMQTPSSWDWENWQLLGLAGLALWPWPGYGFTSNESKSEQQRHRVE